MGVEGGEGGGSTQSCLNSRAASPSSYPAQIDSLSSLVSSQVGRTLCVDGGGCRRENSKASHDVTNTKQNKEEEKEAPHSTELEASPDQGEKGNSQ